MCNWSLPNVVVTLFAFKTPGENLKLLVKIQVFYENRLIFLINISLFQYPTYLYHVDQTVTSGFKFSLKRDNRLSLPLVASYDTLRPGNDTSHHAINMLPIISCVSVPCDFHRHLNRSMSIDKNSLYQIKKDCRSP